MIDWESKGIDLSNAVSCGDGAKKTYCPWCHDGRKPSHRHQRELLCVLDTGWYHCYNCQREGFATVLTDEEKQEWLRQKPGYKDYKKKKDQEPPKEYKKPRKPKTATIDPDVVKWFKEKRHISEETLVKMGVTSCYDYISPNVSETGKGYNNNVIHFNYYRGDELVNVKFRGPRKEFWIVGGAEKIAYNLNGIKNTESCYIVEGEMDALALAEIGYTNVVSVPVGASDGQMHWLVDYYEEYFAMKKLVYICADLDLAGETLRKNLIKHFDPDQYVVIEDYGKDPETGARLKDANDCLIKLGPDALRRYLANGRATKPQGDADMELLGKDLDDLYANGLPQGVKIGFANLDPLVRLEKGRLVILTGTPGSGKSQFLDQVAEKMNYHHGWRFSMFSPEMMPLSLHMAMLVSKFTGKHFDRESINPDLYQKAKERVMDAVHFIDPDSYDLDGILAIAKYQVRKYGCDALVLDPWNDLTMNGEGITKTDDINTALLKILTFTQQQHIVTFVMAHPSKVARNKDGTVPKISLSDISGSIHFYNRADIGIVLTRHSEEGRDYTELTVQKMRFANLGKVGDCYFKYQVGVGRFHPYDPALDTTDWDETNHIEERVVQTAITMPAAAAPSEANVQGFLDQAARMEKESKPRLDSDNDLPFDNNGETPF